MKSFFCPFLSSLLLAILLPAKGFTQNVALTTSATAASNIAQGANNNPIAYSAKMEVTGSAVTVNSIQFTLSGTHDNNDLNSIGIWFNASAPSMSGAVLLNTATVGFAAPHTYTVSCNVPIAAGASMYFIISTNISATATAGNTIKVNGATNPVVFGFTAAPAVTNNQTDLAGILTIVAGAATLTSSPVAAANILQGANNNPIVYAVKMDVTVLPVTVNSIQFTLSGTHDNNDLSSIGIWFNPSTASVTGASLLNSAAVGFAAPHTYTVSCAVPIVAGASGYFIISTNLSATATAGNTIKVDGAANPLIFIFNTAPSIINNQTDVAGTQIITSLLPLTLLSFTGNVINKQEVQLQWVTAGELNTKDFDIEWSDDGIQFKNAASLPAVNSTQGLHYNYIHKLPFDGNNYYRLKMNDKDEGFTYSPTIKINMPVTAAKIIVLQNPVSNFLNLQVRALKNENIVICVLTADGKNIATKSFTVTKGNNQLSWNLSQLAAGNYFISSGNKLFETIRIIKN